MKLFTTAKNIENFHQGSKCFAIECDDTTKEPNELFFKNRLSFYQDEKPHRHKYKGKDEKNKNIPLYFVWMDKDEKMHKLSYVESRQFYCNFYERLAKKTKDFATLKKMHKEGTNLQICGYDGRPLEVEDIEKEYLDPSKPFGHELVLYSLLMLDDENEYPWRKHKTFSF